MAQIYPAHGHVHIEDKGDTFIIHGDYGQEVTMRRVHRLEPGDEFVAVDTETGEKVIWVAYGRFIDRIEARRADDVKVKAQEFQLDDRVEVASKPDEIDFTDPLVVQRYQPRAEFRIVDLQDTIDALQELKKSRR